jgi:hypothetical protein
MGRKLAVSLIVARQLNNVLTKTGRRTPETAKTTLFKTARSHFNTARRLAGNGIQDIQTVKPSQSKYAPGANIYARGQYFSTHSAILIQKPFSDINQPVRRNPDRPVHRPISYRRDKNSDAIALGLRSRDYSTHKRIMKVGNSVGNPKFHLFSADGPRPRKGLI